MTNGELHEILDDENKKISLKEYREILYRLINDCVCSQKEDMIANQFYIGEINAFYIALDLSEHIEESEKDAKD